MDFEILLSKQNKIFRGFIVENELWKKATRFTNPVRIKNIKMTLIKEPA